MAALAAATLSALSHLAVRLASDQDGQLSLHAKAGDKYFNILPRN